MCAVITITKNPVSPNDPYYVGDKPDVQIPDESAATVILDGVNIDGGAPVGVESGGKLTLLLAGTNTLTAGADGAAGINASEGAELIIDSMSSSNAGTPQSNHITNGILTVIGSSTNGANWYYEAHLLRSARRDFDFPVYRGVDNGFRLVRPQV